MTLRNLEVEGSNHSPARPKAISDDMHDFTIRLATKKDLSAISKFATPVVKSMKFYNREHTAKNIYEMSVRDLKDTLRNYKDSLIVAMAKDGSAVGLCVHMEDHGHVDWLDWILVHKSFRKKGLGKAMLNYAMQEAKRHGHHKIWTDTSTKNKPAIKFFQRMGFRKIGVRKRHAFRQDEIVWEKLIK